MEWFKGAVRGSLFVRFKDKWSVFTVILKNIFQLFAGSSVAVINLHNFIKSSGN